MKKIYMLKIEYLSYSNLDIEIDNKFNVYSSFKIAKKEGLKEVNRFLKKLNEKKINKDKIKVNFEITEIQDLEYAENFNIRFDEIEYEIDEIKPTHKVYLLDIEGNIIKIHYEYRIKNSLCKVKN